MNKAWPIANRTAQPSLTVEGKCLGAYNKCALRTTTPIFFWVAPKLHVQGSLDDDTKEITYPPPLPGSWARLVVEQIPRIVILDKPSHTPCS